MKIAFFIAIVCITTSLQAQDYWTFDNCLKYALEHNIQLKIEESNNQLNKITYRQARLNFLPSFDAYVNHNLNGGKTVNQSNYTYSNQNYQSSSLGLEGRMTLFRGFQGFNSILKDKYNLLAGYLSIDKVKIEVTINVLQSYINLIYLNSLLENEESQYEVSQAQIEKTKLSLNLGKSSYKDLLEIKAQRAIEKESIIAIQNDIVKSYLILTQYMGGDSSLNVKIQKDTDINIDASMLDMSFDEIFTTASEKLPDLKIAEYQLMSSEKELAIIRGQKLPSLSIYGSYNSWYSGLANNPRSTGNNSLKYSFGNQIKDNLGNLVSINLSIPIFNRHYLQSNINKAKVNVDISFNKSEQVKQSFHLMIQQLFIDVKEADAKYNSREETLASVNELYRLSEHEYQMGVLSSIDYRIAKNNYSRAVVNVQQSRYELLYKTLVLKYFITGGIQF